MKALKALLVLGLLCSANGYVVKAEKEDFVKTEAKSIKDRNVATNNDVGEINPTQDILITITVDGITNEYKSLNEAFERTLKGESIKVVLNQDLDFNQEGIYKKNSQTNGVYLKVGTENADVVLDLNGHNITNHFKNPNGDFPARGFTLSMKGGTFKVINSSLTTSIFDVERLGQVKSTYSNKIIEFMFGDNIETNTKDLDLKYVVSKYSDFYLGFNGGFKGLQADGSYNFYTSPSEAIKNSTDNKATLVNDYVGTDSFSALTGTKGTIDLNGKSFTTSATAFNLLYSNVDLTIKNGMVYAYSDNVTADSPNIGFIGDSAHDVENISLTLNDVVINSNYQRGIDFHGTDTNLHLNLNNSALNMENENSYGIYMPAKDSSVVLNNASINAGTGVVVKGGELEVIDSKINSFGVENIPTEGTTSGFEETGDAIYVEGNYGFPIKVSVKNSEVISENAQAMRDLFQENEELQEILVESGTFSSDVEKYLSNSVNAKVSTSDGKRSYYSTIEEAMENAKPGDIVETIDKSEEQIEKVTVTFKDGSDSTILSIPKDSEIVWLEPSKSGYVFKGWFDGLNVYTTSDSFTVSEDVEFVAQWEEVITPEPDPKPDYRPSGGSSSGTVSKVTAETVDGDKVKAKEVKIDKDLESKFADKDTIITTIEVGEADDKVVVTYKAGKDYKDTMFYVLELKDDQLVLLDKVKADEKGVVKVETKGDTQFTLATMLNGWILAEDDTWYFFEEDGTPADRWLANATTWFMIEDGKMLTNTWVASSEGRWYYVGNDGSIVYNQLIDGCWINEEGIYYSPTYNK